MYHWIYYLSLSTSMVTIWFRILKLFQKSKTYFITLLTSLFLAILFYYIISDEIHVGLVFLLILEAVLFYWFLKTEKGNNSLVSKR
jgi:hypothetical protein